MVRGAHEVEAREEAGPSSAGEHERIAQACKRRVLPRVSPHSVRVCLFPSVWRGELKILHERVLDQKHRVDRGFRSIFDHYRHHSYTADGYSA